MSGKYYYETLVCGNFSHARETIKEEQDQMEVIGFCADAIIENAINESCIYDPSILARLLTIVNQTLSVEF